MTTVPSPPPEFSRSYARADVSSVPLAAEIAASPDECAALARRFDLLGISALTAKATLVVRHHQLLVEGRFQAKVTQACVASGEPVVAKLAQPFMLRFIDETALGGAPELELTLDDYDDMPLSTDSHGELTLDLGEAVAQSLLLALPRFPRGPNAARTLRDAGVVQEGEEIRGAFAGLKDLLR